MHATWLAFQGENAARIRETVSAEYGYDLARSVDEIRPDYGFDVTCQKTVPEAVVCALESDSFEDAVRNAVSLGGDSDTLAAVAGPIAEAMHGIPDELISRVQNAFLAEAPDILSLMREMYESA